MSTWYMLALILFACICVYLVQARKDFEVTDVRVLCSRVGLVSFDLQA